MNNKMKEMQVAELLAQPIRGKCPYVSPKWDTIFVEQTHLICTSIPLDKDNLSGGGANDYDEDEEKDGGTSEINIGF